MVTKVKVYSELRHREKHFHFMFYLDSVGVISRVLEETVVWVENLSRKEEKEFSGRTSVVQALLPIPLLLFTLPFHLRSSN